ncbi:DUF4252 domain-containing protein [Flavobacterium facile]|jgi:hypothetical protein|uniref:DUF4252 domain-containing protein n=1 Tax=Flavobacterium facile TaxID=2893174 RepID=UPI002E79CAE8|nr:DUF4252 domain-containing protein [Flavobacterium sp. T-12]
MKKLIGIALVVVMMSCKDEEPSLQKYFVKSGEKKEFMSMDISSSILNVNESKLSASEKKALASFEKVNVLAFKKDEKNNAQYSKEVKEVKEILKDTTFQPLIKLNGVGHNASIMLVGDNKEIDELVLFGNQKDLGFTVIRVLGDNMKPEDAMQFFSILQKSNIDMEQLKPILNFVNKK